MFANMTYLNMFKSCWSVCHEKFKWLNTKDLFVLRVEHKYFNYLYLGKLANPAKKNFRKHKITTIGQFGQIAKQEFNSMFKMYSLVKYQRING